MKLFFLTALLLLLCSAQDIRFKEKIVYFKEANSIFDKNIGRIRLHYPAPSNKGAWDVYLVEKEKIKEKDLNKYTRYKFRYFYGQLIYITNYRSDGTKIFHVLSEKPNLIEVTFYDKNDNPTEFRMLKDSLLHGSRIFYYKNTNTKHIREYDSGKAINFKSYYPNSNLKSESHLFNETGWLNCYENDGSLKASIFYENSKIKFINIYHNNILFLKREGEFEEATFFKIDVLNLPQLVTGKITYYNNDKSVISTQNVDRDE